MEALKRLLEESEMRLANALVGFRASLDQHMHVFWLALLMDWHVCQTAAQITAQKQAAAHEQAIIAIKGQLQAETAKLHELSITAARDIAAHEASKAALGEKLRAAEQRSDESSQELQACRATACTAFPGYMALALPASNYSFCIFTEFELWSGGAGFGPGGRCTAHSRACPPA